MLTINPGETPKDEDQGNDPRLKNLLALLQLERDVRRVETRAQLKFIICNDTHRLVTYHQAALAMVGEASNLKIEAISSLAKVEKSPFVTWLKQITKHLLKSDTSRNIIDVTADMLLKSQQEQWFHWQAAHVMWCPLITPSGVLLGGLWLNRKEAFRQSEKVLLERLCDAYAHSWDALEPRRNITKIFKNSLQGRSKWLVLGLVILSLIPVRQTVLAPAQVVAKNPLIVSAPMDGVLKAIHVIPNQPLQAGQLLFELDDTNIRNQYELALEAYKVSQANYLRSSQKAFNNADSKSELNVLKAVQQQRQAEVQYNAELLQRISVSAEQAGVVLFGDANDWLGRPVVVGEKIMTLANLDDTWLEVWLPVDDAIVMEENTELQLFLNIDPLQAFRASIKQTSYEAEVSPQGILAYRLKANFAEGKPLPRLGLKGTARIYGQNVPIIYYVFRRPLAFLRRWVGW